jgi:hypothetical protein
MVDRRIFVSLISFFIFWSTYVWGRESSLFFGRVAWPLRERWRKVCGLLTSSLLVILFMFDSKFYCFDFDRRAPLDRNLYSGAKS